LLAGIGFPWHLHWRRSIHQLISMATSALSSEQPAQFATVPVHMITAFKNLIPPQKKRLEVFVQHSLKHGNLQV
jgi:hypothetical protein